MPKLFADPRDRTKPALCPFCRRAIPRPEELEGLWFEFDGGRCSCGAYFAVDPTARNGGAVLMQVLVQSCDGDWDAAAGLTPDDYRVGYIHKYNSREHVVEQTSFGTIYFVRRRETVPAGDG